MRNWRQLVGVTEKDGERVRTRGVAVVLVEKPREPFLRAIRCHLAQCISSICTRVVEGEELSTGLSTGYPQGNSLIMLGFRRKPSVYPQDNRRRKNFFSSLKNNVPGPASYGDVAGATSPACGWVPCACGAVSGGLEGSPAAAGDWSGRVGAGGSKTAS